MASRFNNKEKVAWRNFWRSDLGEKGLAMIDELRQEWIDKALKAVDTESAEAVNAYIVKASALDAVYELLKPIKTKRPTDD